MSARWSGLSYQARLGLLVAALAVLLVAGGAVFALTGGSHYSSPVQPVVHSKGTLAPPSS